MAEFFAGFGLRDWLLVLGPILVIGILLHGYWRMRVNRSSLKMSLDKSFVSDLNDAGEDADELSLLRAELPNGGARVLSPTEQTSLNLEDDVPVLMDVADEAADEVAEQVTTTIEQSPPEQAQAPREEVRVVQQEEVAKGPLPENLPEKYVVINVMAVNEPFSGQELLECLGDQDMVIGEMNIFHRMSADQTLFSLMNAVEPGSFNIATMNEMSTPALSMFMRVHELHAPGAVFEQMLMVAQNLSEKLGGEVRDETRSVMTTQTIEHCRQELEEYVFKHHS